MEFVILLIEVFIVFNVIMGLASVCTWVERKGSALIQDRIGANRAGRYTTTDVLVLKPFYAVWQALGMLGVINTLLCDAVKALFKEDFVPQGVSNFMHCLAPFLAVLPVFLAFAVVPLAPDFQIFGETVRLQVADGLNAGVLFFLACGSIAVYGVALAGWTSNNKFALLGSLRASAQMISYELAMGVAVATVIVWYSTLDLYAMVEAQKGLWGVILNPTMFIAFVIFFVSGMAETKRGPFDLPESESELVAGYFTEYSGMKFLLFWLGEFAEIALIALVVSLVFFGGWHPLPHLDVSTFSQFLASLAAPVLRWTGIAWDGNLGELHWFVALVGHGILMGKVVFFSVLQIIIRWTLPRFRYDQLMNLGWKVLLEIGFINLLIAAAWKLA